MAGFDYIAAASALHDEAGIDRIVDEYEPLLSRAGGRRRSRDFRPEKGSLPFYFILTGGTEGFVLENLESLASLGVDDEPGNKPPLVLIAHGKHNSLPAALEIAAWAGQEGRAAQIIQLAGADDAAGLAELAAAAKVADSLSGMRKSRIGLVGEPSSWLIASRQSAKAAKESWGASIIPIPFKRLIKAMETRGQRQKAILPEEFISGASFRREASDEDLEKSQAVFEALQSLVEAEKLDALSLRCFDLLSLNGSTGCFALAKLAAGGIDSGCEGDVPSVIALRWVRLLTGRAGWMANPSVIRKAEGGRGSMLLAHCTVPLSLVPSYGIRSHFESGKGAALCGSLPKGPVTLLRIGGARLGQVWAAEGVLTESPAMEGLCRTQALIELSNGDIDALLDAPLGNHLVMAPGSWAGLIDRYIRWAGLNRVQTKKS
jgi:L-fucose isomerase-like protein